MCGRFYQPTSLGYRKFFRYCIFNTFCFKSCRTQIQTPPGNMASVLFQNLSLALLFFYKLNILMSPDLIFATDELKTCDPNAILARGQNLDFIVRWYCSIWQVCQGDNKTLLIISCLSFLLFYQTIFVVEFPGSHINGNLQVSVAILCRGFQVAKLNLKFLILEKKRYLQLRIFLALLKVGKRGFERTSYKIIKGFDCSGIK